MFCFSSGRLEWTQRLSALQLPAGLTRGGSSRASLCSACTRAQERIPGSSACLSVCPSGCITVYGIVGDHINVTYHGSQNVLFSFFYMLFYSSLASVWLLSFSVLFSFFSALTLFFCLIISCMAICRNRKELYILRRDCKCFWMRL